MKRSIIFSTVFLMGVVFVVRCGTTASTTTTSSTISSVSSLPAATGPVTASSSVLRDAFSGKARGVQLFAATTGVKLADLDTISWSGATKSRPFCESARLVKEAYLQSAEPDKILCYIGAMKDNSAFGANVDDGTYQYYTVNTGQETLKIKFKIAKSGDAIQTFEMFMCSNGTTQDGFVSEDVSNLSAVSVITKFIRSAGSGNSSFSFATGTTATGTANTNGTWSAKTIEMQNTSSFGTGGGNGSYRQKATVTQQATKVLLDAFMDGTYGAFTFSNKLYSVIQTLNTDSMATFALGDGSAKYVISNGGQSYNNTASWLGDTQAPLTPATDGEQYATANAATLRTVESLTVTFTAAQTWDCSGTFTAATVSGAGLQTALGVCNAKYGGDDRGYLECRNSSGE